MRFFFTILITTVITSLVFVSISSLIPLSEIEQANHLMCIPLIQKRLKQSRGNNRIILLGGSSMGLGVSAKMISQRTGIQTWNTGLHAGIGYKNIWDLYSDNFDKAKDIIVISPETAMVTRTGRPLNVAVCEMSTLKLTNWKTNLLCAGRHSKRVMKKWTGWGDTKWNYRKQDFDELGDYSVELLPKPPSGRLALKCDPMPSGKQLDDYLGFFEEKQELGYNILYIPSITYKAACLSSLARILEINKTLTEAFGSKLPDDYPYLLEEKYFMETLHHLNPEGRRIKTEAFLEFIKARLATTQQ
ncbi:MAG: hypothetical protein HOA17_08335 [Candidatus Melainabacteria bacterium]|nr:hypothetical protein [Candidatus Melainabacteria bacterium]